MSQGYGAPQLPPGPPPSSSSSCDSYAFGSCLTEEALAAGCSTVLMSVKVSASHSGIRPLCLPGCGDETLRLQLSMDSGKAGEFRLALKQCSGTNPVTISLLLLSSTRTVSPLIHRDLNALSLQVFKSYIISFPLRPLGVT